MRRRVPVLAGSCVAQTQTSDYSLVWADEFNKDGRPDPNNWVYENGFERNEELQWYQPDNAVCRDGMLVIKARRERKPNPNYDPNDHSRRRRRPGRIWHQRCLWRPAL